MVIEPMTFEPGSAVEVRTGGGHFCGLWFSGTAISRVDSDRFLVHFDNLAETAVVGLHRLRPIPPPERHLEFKSGDEVELSFKDLGNGRFVVSFVDSEEKGFPKERMTTPHEWNIHNWVSVFRDKRDIIGVFPSTVLLHMMSFMDTREAVQTCVLSKTWKDHSKQIISLTFLSNLLSKKILEIENFEKFVSWVLFSRDGSYFLYNLDTVSWTKPNLLDRIIKYALFCNVQHLDLDLASGLRQNFESIPLIRCCKSLTSKYLQMHVLKNLHLGWVKFTAGDNGSAEPFSICRVLNSLVLESCSLRNDAQVLRISNSTLSSLAILGGKACQLVLSTPNICSLTIRDCIGHQLFSTYR